ncbi:unnamed protein product [Closterium sp. Naga37s-1]|nr:unnamed protein product [Closterium sp. Naga37s-1]
MSVEVTVDKKGSSTNLRSSASSATSAGKKSSAGSDAPKKSSAGSGASSAPIVSNSSASGGVTTTNSSGPGGGGAGSAKKFKLAELKAATNSFSKKGVLGEGSFGEVYRGTLTDKVTGEVTKVAVKMLNAESSQGMDEWLAEVLLLPSLNHPNLVRLVGYCAEKGEALLVYELCENGSLDDKLFPSRMEEVFDWNSRLKVVQGTAGALVHLHEHNVIHRDLKPSNILLGDGMEAKLTDFGMAKQAAEGVSHVSTRVMGTLGYLDPAYMETGCLREKSDVFSFGVILLQVLTGKDAVDDRNIKLATAMHKHLHPNVADPDKWIDPKLQGKYPRKGALMMAAIAKQCIADNAEDRPEMSDVEEFLNDIQMM